MASEFFWGRGQGTGDRGQETEDKGAGDRSGSGGVGADKKGLWPIKKARPRDLAFWGLVWMPAYRLFRRRLDMPAKPARPAPNSNMVAGSGTAGGGGGAPTKDVISPTYMYILFKSAKLLL